MNNILAITSKELKSYFSTPIGYVVVGLFAVLYGFFFYSMLMIFNQQSLQLGGFGGGGNVDINQQLIRPLFLNASVIMLFVLPLITMRTYSEEKRSGTIELLLTSPLTDVQIILGKFLGAMGLYAAMVAITIPHMLLVFAYGNPDWRIVATGYLGLLLMGGCFISFGLLISSLTRNQIIAGAANFSVFLLLWVINWASSFASPNTQTILNYLSITEHLDDFTKGILDTKHLVYYFSVISFGLYLTARSVDTERWRG